MDNSNYTSIPKKQPLSLAKIEDATLLEKLRNMLFNSCISKYEERTMKDLATEIKLLISVIKAKNVLQRNPNKVPTIAEMVQEVIENSNKKEEKS